MIEELKNSRIEKLKNSDQDFNKSQAHRILWA
jgi:hypothetical protein